MGIKAYTKRQRSTPWREWVDPNARPRGSIAASKGSFSRTVIVPWGPNGAIAGWVDAARDFVGYSEVVADTTTGVNYISRKLPFSHGSGAGFVNAGAAAYLWCETAAPEGDVPRGDDVALNAQYDECNLGLTFTSRPYRLLHDDDPDVRGLVGGVPNLPSEANLARYITPRKTTAVQRLTLPPAAMYWAIGINPPATIGCPNAGLPTIGADIILHNQFTLSLKWWQVPVEGYPRRTVAALVGSTNGKPFGNATDSLIGLYPSGTLVFMNPEESEPYQMPNGGFALDVTFKFYGYTYGANFRYLANPNKVGGVAGQPGFYLATRDTAGNPVGPFTYPFDYTVKGPLGVPLNGFIDAFDPNNQ